MKVLITGGAGYIGTSLIESLVNSDHVSELIVYDNLSRGNRNLFIGNPKLEGAKLTFVQGELLDSRKLNSILKGVDLVYHLAANVTTPFSDQNPHLFEQVNHWGTAELVYALEKSNVKRLVYLSSVSVYGTSNSSKKVGDELNPRTFYGISKMRAEAHVERLMNKMETYIIRCGNVYGYNRSMRFDAVINTFLFEANFKNRITINGTGEQRRPFIHIDKAAQTLLTLSQAELANGIYNLVDKNWAIGEVVKELRAIYPDLEMIFVNQHMKMRELEVEGSQELTQMFSGNTKSLQDELRDFKAAFTF
ncbi:MAG: SDR family NAD-dependent epimerase/dehydratase [Bacteroidetes bacterium]|nr:MAG: SDR family NAD-dependent epimerase/dehydratase [Bacteroidota bacterium]MBL1143908.1 SDR family NAD-dependent epimerase/dehydratase [Bacteroidota bacterium]NOG56709.1 SDR family oxidoreductase [Bacteroidota bacterium]